MKKFLSMMLAGFLLIACTPVKEEIVSGEPDPDIAELEAMMEESVSESIYCDALGEVSDVGRMVLPVNDVKYGELDLLGQLFTADDCGLERVAEVYGVNEDLDYIMGSTIWLNEAPSADLVGMFSDLGFECDDEVEDAKCTYWSLREAIAVDLILRLKSFADEMKMDDCTLCG